MKQARILIVEDEGVVALDIAEGLRGYGYEVVAVVDSGEESLVKAAELRPDLVLMDIVLKRQMDGVEAARLIFERFKIPVVFLTAHADEATLQRATLAYPYGYILKPFEIVDLRSTIEITLHRCSVENKGGAGGPEAGTRPISETKELIDHPFIGALEDPAARLQFLKHIPLFQQLSDPELTELSNHMIPRSARPGEFLLHEGREIEGGFIVATGRIAMVKHSSGGKELIAELLPPGDAFGLISNFGQTTVSSSARSQTTSQLLWIPQSQFINFVEKNPIMHRAIAEELSIRLRKSHELSSFLAHARAESRIVAAILALVPKFGRGTTNSDQCRIYITRRELSELTGTTIETAIRVTKNLEREGLLDLTKPGVIKIVKFDGLSDFTKQS